MLASISAWDTHSDGRHMAYGENRTMALFEIESRFFPSSFFEGGYSLMRDGITGNTKVSVFT